MMFKPFTFFAILTACGVAPALAMPTIQFVDNLDSSVTLQVATPDTGSLAAEVAVMITASDGLSLTGVSIADPAVWDTANPGNNPFTGGVTNGLYLDELANGNVFVSYGSDVVTPGTYDFLDIEFDGAGTLQADGVVAQLGVSNSGLTASIDVVPEPSSTLLLALGALAVTLSRRLV